MRFELHIRQHLQGESRAEQPDGQCPAQALLLRRQRNSRMRHPERECEGQSDDGQESRLREELGEERPVPEPRLLLQLLVPRILPAPGDAPRRDVVEQPQSPGGHTAEEHLLRPGQGVPSDVEADIAVVHGAPDGAPPGVDDLARRPEQVLDLHTARSSRDNIRGNREARVQCE